MVAHVVPVWRAGRGEEEYPEIDWGQSQPKVSIANHDTGRFSP